MLSGSSGMGVGRYRVGCVLAMDLIVIYGDVTIGGRLMPQVRPGLAEFVLWVDSR